MNVATNERDFQSLGRRAILKGALALPLATCAVPALATTGETSIMRLFSEWTHLRYEIEETGSAMSEEEFEARMDALKGIEHALLDEPVTCAADLAAKVIATTRDGDFVLCLNIGPKRPGRLLNEMWDLVGEAI